MMTFGSESIDKMNQYGYYEHIKRNIHDRGV